MTENKSEYSMTETTVSHKDGVYLRYRDGHEEWFDGKNKKVNIRGIAIHLGERYTCVSLFDVEDFNEGTTSFPLLEDCSNITDEDNGPFIKSPCATYSDMDGEKHTKRLIRRGCKIPLAEDKYIPSTGEWVLMMMFFHKVQEALCYANGEILKNDFYWTSTEFSSTVACGVLVCYGETVHCGMSRFGHVRTMEKK